MRKFNGFSLMEMMVVLLIVAIVIAASAPMISKRMVRTAEVGSPWLFSGINGSIFFNGNGNNRTAMIGRSVLPDDENPRLLIDAGNDAGTAALSIYRGNDFIANLIARANTVGFAGITGNVGPQQNSVYLGTNQTIRQNLEASGFSVGIGANTTIQDGSTVVGASASAGNPGAIAIGRNSSATGYYSVAIGSTQAGEGGTNTEATGYGAIAIGSEAKAPYESIAIGRHTTVNSSDSYSIAIGAGATVNSMYSIAIGKNAQATATRSVAIGEDAVADRERTIVLGTPAKTVTTTSCENVPPDGHRECHDVSTNISATTVYIPGNLVVDGNVLLGRLGASRVFLNVSDNNGGNGIVGIGSGGHENNVLDAINKQTDSNKTWDIDKAFSSISSDRRLKNVGEMFAGGLEQVKKLEVYNYTFKKDSANTPRVGVMAQDLMKVFPSAVTKGEDGYLRIRMEDMFYAVVNAVKELDNKLTAIAEQLKTIADDMSIIKNKNTEYEKVITELVEQNKALMKKNAEFEERLAKLEGKAIKKETKEMTKSVKQESKLAKQEEKAKLKAQKQAEKEAQKAEKAAKKAEKEGKK